MSLWRVNAKSLSLPPPLLLLKHIWFCYSNESLIIDPPWNQTLSNDRVENHGLLWAIISRTKLVVHGGFVPPTALTDSCIRWSVEDTPTGLVTFTKTNKQRIEYCHNNHPTSIMLAETCQRGHQTDRQTDRCCQRLDTLARNPPVHRQKGPWLELSKETQHFTQEPGKCVQLIYRYIKKRMNLPYGLEVSSDLVKQMKTQQYLGVELKWLS